MTENRGKENQIFIYIFLFQTILLSILDCSIRFVDTYTPTFIHTQIQNILYKIQPTWSWLKKSTYKKVEMRSHEATSRELGQQYRIPIKKTLLKVK